MIAETGNKRIIEVDKNDKIVNGNAAHELTSRTPTATPVWPEN